MLNEKALTVSQRLKRAASFRRHKVKIRRARELARKRLASKKSIKRRSEIAARELLKRRMSPRKDVKYAQLTPSEKIMIDKRMEGKIKLIKKIAARLLPKIQRKEYERLKAFLHGKGMKHLSSDAGITNALNEETFAENYDALCENVLQMIDDVSGEDDKLFEELTTLLEEATEPEETIKTPKEDVFVKETPRELAKRVLGNRRFKPDTSKSSGEAAEDHYSFTTPIKPSPDRANHYPFHQLAVKHDITIKDDGKFEHTVTNKHYHNNVHLTSTYDGKFYDKVENLEHHLGKFASIPKELFSKSAVTGRKKNSKLDKLFAKMKEHLKGNAGKTAKMAATGTAAAAISAASHGVIPTPVAAAGIKGIGMALDHALSESTEPMPKLIQPSAAKHLAAATWHEKKLENLMNSFSLVKDRSMSVKQRKEAVIEMRLHNERAIHHRDKAYALSESMGLTSTDKSTMRRGGKKPGNLFDKFRKKSKIGKIEDPNKIYDPYYPEKNKDDNKGDKGVTILKQYTKNIDSDKFHAVKMNEFLDRLPTFDQTARAVKQGSDIYNKARSRATDEFVRRTERQPKRKPVKKTPKAPLSEAAIDSKMRSILKNITATDKFFAQQYDHHLKRLSTGRNVNIGKKELEGKAVIAVVSDALKHRYQKPYIVHSLKHRHNMNHETATEYFNAGLKHYGGNKKANVAHPINSTFRMKKTITTKTKPAVSESLALASAAAGVMGISLARQVRQELNSKSKLKTIGAFGDRYRHHSKWLREKHPKIDRYEQEKHATTHAIRDLINSKEHSRENIIFAVSNQNRMSHEDAKRDYATVTKMIKNNITENTSDA